MAHYWLLKNKLKANKWYFVSDDSGVLETAVFRIFANEIRADQARYFTCQVDKSLSLEESGTAYFRNRNELFKFAKEYGYEINPISYVARKWLESRLYAHDFYSYKEIDGIKYPLRGVNPIKSLLADKDEGYRLLCCKTDVSDLTKEELARLLIRVNGRTINNFFQGLRRKVSILERPLTTGRGDGKTYIYSNYNPRYAQYVTTIFRTFYNFCWVTKWNGVLKTPAQRLGIANRVYTEKDIIYFK